MLALRLTILATGCFVIGVIGFGLSGLLPVIAHEFGASIGLTGQVFTVYAFTYGIGAPFIAALTGRFEWRMLLAGSLLFTTAGCLLAGLASSLVMLMAAYFVMAIGSAIYLPGIAAATVLMVPLEKRATAVGFVLGGALVAMALAGPIGMWIVGFGGWRMIFLLSGAVAFASAVGIVLTIPATLPRQMTPMAERLAAMVRRDVVLALLTITAIVGGSYIVFIYLSAVIGAGPDPSQSHMGGILLTLGLGAIAGTAFGGPLGDRMGMVYAQTALFALAALSLIAISAVNFIAGIGAAMPLVYVLVACWGFGFWGGYPAHVGRLVSMAPDLAAVTLAINASALYAGIAAGSVIGAQILAWRMPEALGLAGGSLILAALAFLHWSVRHLRTRVSHA